MDYWTFNTSFGFWTDTMIGVFVILFWSGATLAGARFLSGAESGTIDLEFGPEVFDLHLNRFRYRIHLIPILARIKFDSPQRKKRLWLIPLLSAAVGLCGLTAALVLVEWAILGVGAASLPEREFVVRGVTANGLAAASGIAVGDVLHVKSIDELAKSLVFTSNGGAHFTVERDGIQREVTIRPRVSKETVQPLGLSLVTSSHSTTITSEQIRQTGAGKHPILELRCLPDRLFGVQGLIIAFAGGLAVAMACGTFVLAVSHAAGTRVITTTVLVVVMLALGYAWYILVIVAVLGIATNKFFPADKAPMNLVTGLLLFQALWAAFSGIVAFSILTGVAELRGASLVWTL